jgi:hypothetical protein
MGSDIKPIKFPNERYKKEMVMRPSAKIVFKALLGAGPPGDSSLLIS